VHVLINSGGAVNHDCVVQLHEDNTIAFYHLQISPSATDEEYILGSAVVGDAAGNGFSAPYDEE
jgi:hypothetical protein